MEAHAEDCVLVPPDVEAGLEPQEPILLILRIMFFALETGLPFVDLALVARCAAWARSLKWMRPELR